MTDQKVIWGNHRLVMWCERCGPRPVQVAESAGPLGALTKTITYSCMEDIVPATVNMPGGSF